MVYFVFGKRLFGCEVSVYQRFRNYLLR